MNITPAIDAENKKLAKQVDMIYSLNREETEPQKENDFKKAFIEIDTQIRQLNSELRRILKAEEYEPTYIQINICNSFDGIKNELIPFKVP
jgi:hypothetical protein